MKNAISFIRNIGNPHGMEWRKIGFFNLWAYSDWDHYARPGLHWSSYYHRLILSWDYAGECKDITLWGRKPSKPFGA